ncbi:uncharacterized protein METZ01_LOCUS407416, partial [marine metagenome]
NWGTHTTRWAQHGGRLAQFGPGSSPRKV